MANKWNICWVGPREMSDNGLELHAVVAQAGAYEFYAGTRYGPKGTAMPELGHQEFWCVAKFVSKEQAISAAQGDCRETLRGCNDHARTEKRLESATTPGRKTPTPKPRRARTMER